MAKASTEIGLETVKFPIERGKIREFARAIHDDNPIFGEDGAVPAPLTFVVASAHFRDADSSPAKLLGSLDVDFSRLLHGESEWEYHRLPRAGDVLVGTTRLGDVFEKEGGRGGTMRFIVIETEWVDQDGDAAITERMTLIETAGVVG